MGRVLRVFPEQGRFTRAADSCASAAEADGVGADRARMTGALLWDSAVMLAALLAQLAEGVPATSEDSAVPTCSSSMAVGTGSGDVDVSASRGSLRIADARCVELGAHVDNSSGEPAWVVRNMRLIGVGALVIGWVLGIALMRQAERDATIWEDRTEEYERKKEMDALKRDAKDIDKD